MNHLTLDLSLTATGWAHTLTNYGVETTPGKSRGVQRLAQYQHWLTTMLNQYTPAVVTLEGYAYAKGGRAHQIGEWGGIARLTLNKTGIPFVEIPPATLKKFATGRGNAPKPDMRMELYKRSGLDVQDDNAVDALWLLALARQLAGTPFWDMPKVNVEALAKVDWPDVGLLLESVGTETSK